MMVGAFSTALAGSATKDHELVDSAFVCQAEQVAGHLNFMLTQAGDLLRPVIEKQFQNGTCFLTGPQLFEILEVIGTPVKDWEGDLMVIVRVGPGLFTIAWQQNSTLLLKGDNI